MKVRLQSPILFLVAAFVAGCAWTPQKITLAPEINPPVSNLGNGATVVVQVRDERPVNEIGYRGWDSKGAGITTDQDLAGLVQKKIIEGLSQQGFKAVSTSDAPARHLKVQIIALQYVMDMDFWKGQIRTKATLQARSNSEGRSFEQYYVGEREERTVEAPSAKTNARLINGVLSDALGRLLADQRLVTWLAN